MRMYVGEPWRVAATIEDPDTELAADPEAVTAEFTKPDGTSINASATRDSAGHYHAQIALDQIGKWSCVFRTSGTYEGVAETSIAVRTAPSL